MYSPNSDVVRKKDSGLQIRFDHGPAGEGTRFSAPLRLIEAYEPADVPAALDALDAALAAGDWLAGYASYELGYALEPKLSGRMPAARRLPLLRFGVYAAPDRCDLPAAAGDAGAPRPLWSEERYSDAFAQLHRLIGAGDLYQANLTFPLETEVSGDVAAVYAALVEAQPVKHGALVMQEGLPALLSRSPELFFRLDGQGGIATRPMKGTQPRSDDPAEDARRKAWLSQDEKNRAENLMIVDLLRNDLSRVAKAGSVKVPELFHVESYATVHQMVSLVTGQLQVGAGLGAILRALFPCGSITGAPKVRAMQVIDDLEGAARDIYCGSIGWMAPDGRAEFNVAIRTLMVEASGAARLNVGGGIVWDSTAAAEYEEALWKARYAHLKTPISA